MYPDNNRDTNMQINTHVATDKLKICTPAYLHICTYSGAGYGC